MPETQSPYITQHQARFAATAQPLQTGEFEIFCITAGEANGWTFPPDVLKNSLSLWDGAHCFLDHAWFSRSVRDIAGQIVNPVWDDENQGIRATLKSFGPGGELLTEFGRQILAESEDDRPKIGFSADILFTSNARTVKEILRVISVDLVYDPARGGAFLRAMNQMNGGFLMSELNLNQPTLPNLPPISKSASHEPEPTINESETQLDEAQHSNPPNDPPTPTNPSPKDSSSVEQVLSEARQVRLQMCEMLLESTLSSSNLPKPIQERIRKQFQGQVFEASVLQEAIQDARTMLSELTAAQSVNGPGRISSVFNESDKLQVAVDDLFGNTRSDDLKSLQVPSLSGVRELYLMLTGDHELHGGYYPDRVQLATTADFTGLIKNALNKIVVNTWEMLGRAGYDWWKYISQIEHFNTLHEVTGTLIGTVGDLPAVAEGEPYTELVIGDSPETASFTKYGGYIPLTLELIDRDETRKLKAYARELGSAGLRKISKLVAEIFTANLGVGPTMADGGALFNATAVTTAGGHANLLTTALSTTSWDAACAAVYDQPMLIKNETTYYGTGPKLAINPKFCLVPRVLQKTAFEILQGNFVREASYVYDNVLKGTAVPIVVPEWTDPTDWAAACDPLIAPAIFVGERFGIMPEIYVAGDELSPAVFMSDEHRLKVRHFLAVWVNDFRPLHKNNVADTP
jgi:hypothetical protein